MNRSVPKLLLAAIVLILYSLSSAPCLYADFEDMGAGGRAIGMGNAFCALSDDAFSIYYNPAGLGFIRQAQVGADYGRLYLGLDDESNLNSAFVSVLIPYFVTGIRTKDIKVPVTTNVKKTKTKKNDKKQAKENILKILKGEKEEEDKSDAAGSADKEESENEKKESKSEKEAETDGKILRHWGTFGIGWSQFSLYGYYQESAYYISFGKSLKERWAYGFNLKLLREQYTIDEYLRLSPVFDYGAKSSISNYSADIGVIYNILPRLFAGFSVNNINQPDLGLKEKEQLPATIRTGIAWRQRDVKWAIDSVYKDGFWYGSAGLEKWFKNLFAMRGGINIGSRNYINSSVGFSLSFQTVQVDYVFQMPLTGIKDIAGSHRMSLVYRFGRRPKEELEPGSLELYYSNLQEEVAGLKSTLAEVRSEKKKLEEILIEESTLRIRERIRAAKAAARREKYSTEEEKEVRHVVKKGETLQYISKKYYDDDKYWNRIYQANKDKVGIGGVLKPGQVLLIPKMTGAVKQSGPLQREVETVPVKKIEKVIPLIEVKPTTEPVGIKKAEPEKVQQQVTKKEKKKKPSPATRKHIVKQGENLRTIAQKYYKDNKKWKDIYKANKDKVVGGQVAPGTEIIIP
ncbi:MAG: LysM peptidoglycan-binding domain-containing protein [Endomicrobiales bacterium]|nr:LysM peptidoglycan-binding domain-containing protein [Endomicrobiales bacterium]